MTMGEMKRNSIRKGKHFFRLQQQLFVQGKQNQKDHLIDTAYFRQI